MTQLAMFPEATVAGGAGVLARQAGPQRPTWSSYIGGPAERAVVYNHRDRMVDAFLRASRAKRHAYRRYIRSTARCQVRDWTVLLALWRRFVQHWERECSDG